MMRKKLLFGDLLFLEIFKKRKNTYRSRMIWTDKNQNRLLYTLLYTVVQMQTLTFLPVSSLLSHFFSCLFILLILAACKRKEQDTGKERNNTPKKSRLVFTDLQRRTLLAIFKENKRPSKEMQVTISQQLGLELSTVSNFFMNARRRSLDKWTDDGASPGAQSSASSTCTKA